MSVEHLWKYHGAGNDFLVARSSHPLADARWAPLLCDRHRGFGADGLLILSDPEAGGDVRLTIINSDGSRPEMCGNGVRCVARHLVEVELFKPELVVESDAGPRPIHVVSQSRGEWLVSVDMGMAEVSALHTQLAQHAETLTVRGVSMGNPHAVAFVASMPGIEEVDSWGAFLNASHPAFPTGVNLEFAVQKGDSFDVAVYERGVGRTQACGTGACAVAAAAWAEERTSAESIVVGLPGGDLVIERREEHVWMTGGVESVYRAKVDDAWVEERKQG